MIRTAQLLDQYKRLGTRIEKKDFVVSLSREDRDAIRKTDREFLMDDLDDLNNRADKLLEESDQIMKGWA